MEEQRKRGGLVGPAILIIVGLVFLLNNLGVTTVDWWDLLRLWPILLIAAGLDLLVGRRSVLGSVLVLIVMLALLGAGLWLMNTWDTTERMEAQTISEPLAEAASAEVEIRFGVGRLHIDSLPESNRLIEGTAQLRRGERLEQERGTAGNTARYTLKSRGETFGPFPEDWGEEKGWELSLNRDVPMRLKVSVGVGVADVELRRMNLTDLQISPGIGKTTVVLPEEGQLTASIDGAIGQVVVEVPQGMALRAEVTPGLGGSSAPSDYRRQDDVYTSPGYDEAENRTTLKASVGIGQIVIREYQGD